MGASRARRTLTHQPLSIHSMQDRQDFLRCTLHQCQITQEGPFTVIGHNGSQGGAAELAERACGAERATGWAPRTDVGPPWMESNLSPHHHAVVCCKPSKQYNIYIYIQIDLDRYIPQQGILWISTPNICELLCHGPWGRGSSLLARKPGAGVGNSSGEAECQCFPSEVPSTNCKTTPDEGPADGE